MIYEKDFARGTIKVRRNSFLKAVVISIICIAVSVFLIIDNNAPEYYQYLFLLPLSFGILNLIFVTLYDGFNNVGVAAIWGLEAFRMVVTPFIMRLGEYNSVMKVNIDKNVPTAIALMIYETTVVFIVVSLNKNKTVQQQTMSRKINKINSIIFLLLAFLLIVAVFYPNSITSFKTIFDSKSDTFTTWTGLGANRFETGTFSRIIVTLFTLIFSWTRYLLPIAVIIWAKKHIGNNIWAIIISMIPIVLQMLFITATIMDGILCAFVLMFVLVKYYPHYGKELKIAAYVSFFAIIGFYFTSRYYVKGDTNSWRFISENAIAYLSGIDNVAAMLNVSKSERASTYFFNLYGAIPFNSTIFGLSGDKLAAVFNAANGRNDGHIAPTIGAGWYYYGFLLAPIESVLFAKISTKLGAKAENESNIWRYMIYILASIMTAMAFNAYTTAIVLNYATTLIIPIMILTQYTDDTKFAQS